MGSVKRMLESRVEEVLKYLDLSFDKYEEIFEFIMEEEMLQDSTIEIAKKYTLALVNSKLSKKELSCHK